MGGKWRKVMGLCLQSTFLFVFFALNLSSMHSVHIAETLIYCTHVLDCAAV